MKIILTVCALALLIVAAIGSAYDLPIPHDPSLAFGFTVVICLYLIPAITAETRRHRQRLAILMLNLLLGWTLLGWVGAMVWACTSDIAPYDPKDDPWAKSNKPAREWRFATAFKPPPQIIPPPINNHD